MASNEMLMEKTITCRFPRHNILLYEMLILIKDINIKYAIIILINKTIAYWYIKSQFSLFYKENEIIILIIFQVKSCFCTFPKI